VRVSYDRICMIRTESATRHFGTPATSHLRKTEWKRLGVFLAFGLAAFLFAVVGASFVPLGLPDTLRRWAHPTIFVPLGTLITALMLRRDVNDVPKSERFSPWPVARSSAGWLAAGVALLAATIPVFVLAFGLRWSNNGACSWTAVALTLWGIFITAAAEEIAFRGYAFWHLIRLIGFWPAQAIVAGLFILSHLTLGGYALLPALVGTVAGSLLYGAVFARTQSLAAPIAIHTGWNVAQHLLLSPLDPSATPLLVRFPHEPTPGEFALMLGWVGLVLVAGTVFVLRFKDRVVE
jgi:membrane protease YdiL (CAAX protease family)